jgi:hypothetical protein
MDKMISTMACMVQFHSMASLTKKQTFTTTLRHMMQNYHTSIFTHQVMKPAYLNQFSMIMVTYQELLSPILGVFVQLSAQMIGPIWILLSTMKAIWPLIQDQKVTSGIFIHPMFFSLPLNHTSIKFMQLRPLKALLTLITIMVSLKPRLKTGHGSITMILLEKFVIYRLNLTMMATLLDGTYSIHGIPAINIITDGLMLLLL